MSFESANTLPNDKVTPSLKAAGQSDIATENEYKSYLNHTIQCKLTVGAADDPYEREADMVAEQVMRMPEPNQLQLCADCDSKIQRQEVESEEPVAKSQLASQATEPDFLGLKAPFFERNAMHLWDPDSALGVWKYNFSFFRRFGLDDAWSGKAANLTAPFFINSQLKVQNPTWWEVTDKELNTTSIVGSLPVFSFDADFRNWKPLPFLQKKPFESNTLRKCDCDKEEKDGTIQRGLINEQITPFIQRQAEGDSGVVSDSLNSRIGSARGNGSSLDHQTASYMSSRFGADFAGVKVHTDAAAVQMNKELNAKAFTVGSDVFFNNAQYQPSTHDGKKLIAHELTHVVQQGATTSNTLDRQVSFIQKKEEEKKFITQSKEVDEGDKKIQVERIITRAECKTKSGSSSATGGFKNNKVMFEASACKNDVSGEASGNIDFTEFVDGADKLVKSLPNISVSPNAGDKLAEEVAKNFKNDKLRASLKLSLRFNHFRIEAKGSGAGNLNNEYEGNIDGIIRYANGQLNIELGGGFSKVWDQLKSPGEIKVHLYTDVGPIIIRVDGKYDSNNGASVEGKIFDTDLTKKVGFSVKYEDKDGDKRVTFNLVFTIPERIPTENAPDCTTCQCDTPQIEYRCTEHKKEDEEPAPGEPKVIPLFYKYATALPRDDEQVSKDVYANTIKLIIDDLKQGYTIKQIEGYTSPEGSLGANIPGKFEGNKSLSFNRADAAKKAIKAGIDKAKADFNFSLIMRDVDKVKANLENAAKSDPPLLPMDEMHGADSSNPDIKESKLFSHLSKELKAPDEGEQDILEKENVKGKALPEPLQELAEKDVTSFRTGIDGKRKLTEKQRLERLYPWLRRALVTLEPPVPERKPISVDDILRNFVGNPVPCTEKHKSVFLNEPMPENEKLFINNCKGK